MVLRREERLAEAARLYYVEDMTQSEVAERLGTTRSNVSRLLATARREGIIRFRVAQPLRRQEALESALVETHGLADAVVLAADAPGDALDRTGELAARWLARHVADGQTITLSWGRTLARLAAHLDVEAAYDVEVVQLGGDLQLDPRLSGHELVREIAARLGGRYSYLHAPALLDSASTAQALRAHPPIAEQLARARSADLAVVGIGGFGEGFAAQVLESAHLSEEERERLRALDPAGDIAARFYDDRGREVDSPLAERVLALDLDELRVIPQVVGVAAGAEKGRALWAALRGGLVDALVCDQAAAAAALHRDRAAQPDQAAASPSTANRSSTNVTLMLSGSPGTTRTSRPL